MVVVTTIGLRLTTTHQRTGTTFQRVTARLSLTHAQRDGDCQPRLNIATSQFFDPCPEGWRLPTEAEYSNFSTTTFTWDATNSGRTYNGNWFPAAGYRFSDDGSVSVVGGSGYCWSASPFSENGGYFLNFGSGSVYPADNYYRAYGFSVRCVQEKGGTCFRPLIHLIYLIHLGWALKAHPFNAACGG